MSKKRILIIDDDAQLCEELAEILKCEGFEVETATDSLIGAGLIKRNNHNIVILDFKMPNLTAVDLLKQARAGNVKARFFLISGRPFIDKTIEEEGLSGMIEAVIGKPFDCGVLLEKIRGLDI